MPTAPTQLHQSAVLTSFNPHLQTAKSPFIVGVDHTALWLSPPTESPIDETSESLSSLDRFAVRKKQEEQQQLFPSIDSWFAAVQAPTPSREEHEQQEAAEAYYEREIERLHSDQSKQQQHLPDSPNSLHSLFFEEELFAAIDNDKDNIIIMAAGDKPSISTEGGDFQLFKPGGGDACSYDLRDTQEPATVQNEYPNYGKSGEETDGKDNLQREMKQVDAEPGPVCFPATRQTPVPSSPHFQKASIQQQNQRQNSPRMANSPRMQQQDIKPQGSANNSPLFAEPRYPTNLSGSTSEQQQRPTQRSNQPSFLKNTGDGIIRTPGPGQMLDPKDAFNDFADVYKQNHNGMSQEEEKKIMMQALQQRQQQQQQQQQQGAMRGGQQQQQQQHNMQQSQNHHMQQMHQMIQQHQQQTQQQQVPPPYLQNVQPEPKPMMQHNLQQSQPRPQQQPYQTQQQMQQQQPKVPQQQQPYTYSGYTAPAQSGSSDIKVPSSATSTSSNNPSNGNGPLPPLPVSNYQSAPAPFSFPTTHSVDSSQQQPGSFFSHQAILASMAAEENAKAAAAAAAAATNGSANNSNNINNPYLHHFGQQHQQSQPQQQQPYQPAVQSQQQGTPMNAQQQQQMSGMGGYAIAGYHPSSASSLTSSTGPSGVGGTPVGAGVGAPTDAAANSVVAQHFGHQPNSPDSMAGGHYSSRKRGKGRTISRSNSINGSNSSRNGNRNNPMLRNSIGAGGAAPGLAGDQMNADVKNEEADDVLGNIVPSGGTPGSSTTTRSGRGVKRRSASAAQSANAAVAALENMDDNGLDFPGTSTSAGGMGAEGTATAGGDGGPLTAPTSPSASSMLGEDDEWVAEASDDSFGKPAKKKARKSVGGTSGTPRGRSAKASSAALQDQLQQGEAGSLFYAAASAGGGAGSPGLQPLAPASSGGGGSSSKASSNRPAAPGTGNIVCGFVDLKTGQHCPVRFRRPYDQARHMETVHHIGTEDKPKWTCQTCSKTFSRKDALIRHGRISSHTTG